MRREQLRHDPTANLLDISSGKRVMSGSSFTCYSCGSNVTHLDINDNDDIRGITVRYKIMLS